MTKFQNPALIRRGFYVSGLFVFSAFFLCATPHVVLGKSLVSYNDPALKFSFQYSKNWGEVVPGTNDGFGDRVAARRFSSMPGGPLGGEAVLMKGRVMLDIQALGGLYDAISLEMLPPPILLQVLKALPAPTASNFCSLLKKASHLDTSRGFFRKLEPALRKALAELDHTRNIKPRVVSCKRKGDTIAFHKEATYKAGALEARQHIFGAIRFLKGKFSAFQLVQGGPKVPTGEHLKDIAAVVRSVKLK